MRILRGRPDPRLLLFGHEGLVHEVAVDPRGRRVASGGEDTTVRVWPMPEGPPFHTLPHMELLVRLRGVTNLRAVEDRASATGYRIVNGPFPGWKTVPTW